MNPIVIENEAVAAEELEENNSSSFELYQNGNNDEEIPAIIQSIITRQKLAFYFL